jgi:hypothetical protein
LVDMFLSGSAVSFRGPWLFLMRLKTDEARPLIGSTFLNVVSPPS